MAELGYRPPPKPQQWNVNRGAVAERYRYLWKDLIFALPYWERGGNVIDVVSGVHGTNSTVAWRQSPHAHGVNYANNGHTSFGTNPGRFFDFGQTNELTLVAVAIQRDRTKPAMMLLNEWGGATEGSIHWRYATGKNQLYIRNAADTAQDFIQADTQLQNNQIHCIAITWQRGLFKAYMNGVKDATDKATSITDIHLNGGHDVRVGQKSNNTNNLIADVHLQLLFKRALSDDEIREMARDPYGVFRPAAVRPLIAPAPAAPAAGPKLLQLLGVGS